MPAAPDNETVAWADAIRAQISVRNIRSHVLALSDPRSRLYAPEAMVAAENYILAALHAAGWRAEPWPFELADVEGMADRGGVKERSSFGQLAGVNLIATLDGAVSAAAVVVVAHYDTVRGSPGALDNTAAVGVVLELARVLRGQRFNNSVVLALTDMEELGMLGALAMVPELLSHRPVLGAINLEAIGYLDREPFSQYLPPGVGLVYRQQAAALERRQWRGDFTAVLYNGPAAEWAGALVWGLQRYAGPGAAIGVRDPTDLPAIGRLMKHLVPGVRNFGRSDHCRFWEAGLPGVMLTDTADFRYPHYHRPTDTIDRVDFERVADVASATAAAVGRFAGVLPVHRHDQA